MVDSQLVPDHLPPQNLEAEQCVLGSMLLDRASIGDVLLVLDADDFYMPTHAEIFRTLTELFDHNEPVDLVIATNALKARGKLEAVGGVDTLVGLMEAVPSSAHAHSYANLVRAASEKRRLVQAAQEILRDAHAASTTDVEDLLDGAEQKIFAIAQGRAVESSASMHDLVKAAMLKVDRLQESDGQAVTSGLKTHFTDLDRLVNGLAPGALYVVAGRPSMGKTSFTTSILDNICVRDRIPAALFTLEVTKEQVAENMLCSNARVDAHRLMRGELSNDEYAKVPLAAGRLAQAPLFVDDTPGMTMTRLRAKARRLKSRHDIQLVAVDYLQLLTLGQHVESRQLEISRLSGALKQLARELKVPVIALSQLNRAVEARADKKPLMGDLRESGSIEQDADAIILLYRKEYYFPEDVASRGSAEVIVAKNRNGPTGSVELNFHAHMMRFDNAHRFPEPVLGANGPGPII